MHRISPCLWFDNQAVDAAEFYTTVFKNSKVGLISHYGKAGSEVSGQKVGSVMTVDVQIEDLAFNCLNGGPAFKFTPAISFFVNCVNEQDATKLWKNLSEGGIIRMAFDKYPWADNYGWTADKFGVEWQVMLAKSPSPLIVPSLLFVENLFGKGEEALKFYMSVFPNSKIESMTRDEKHKSIMHCSFTLDGQRFVLMDGSGEHKFKFNEATSFIVKCKSQAEIDYYWDELSKGGEPGPCGWLKDKFGVSWQIVPAQLANLMADPIKSDKVMAELLKMKKLDISMIAGFVS